MGLDISAMRGLTIRRDLTRSEDWEVINRETGKDVAGNKFYVANIIEDFKDVSDGLEDGAVYEFEDSIHVRAGSYGGYNRWRNMLCMMALGVSDEIVWKNPKKFYNAPFFQLINFSDCDGVIGTETCVSLYLDFRNNYPRAVEYASRLPEDWYGEVWLDKYREWMSAFEFASKNGCVDFH